MSVVIALLNMQSSRFEDERMIQAFNDAGNRIRSMALVHEKLCDARDLTQINLREYIESAIPCGLILHEDDESVIHLRVQDNGWGTPVGFDFRRDGNLGHQTVFLLGESQLNGKVEFRSGNGLECSVSFPTSG